MAVKVDNGWLAYTEATEAKTGFVHVTRTSKAVMETRRFSSTLFTFLGMTESSKEKGTYSNLPLRRG